MISIPQGLIETVFLPGLLAATRIIGLFLAAPFFALQTIPQRFRVGLALVIAFAIPVQVGTLASVSISTSTAGFGVLVGGELLLGLAMGWLIRIGLIVFDITAEVLSIQTGLSFAATYNPDQALPSGVLGTLFGLLGLALMFVLNLHLIAIEILFDSFRTLAPGQWPRTLELNSVANLLTACFGIGVILALPFIAINLVAIAAQGFLGRTSPQLNLFSIGFAVTIPLGVFLVYALLLVFPQALERSLEAVYLVLRRAFGLG